MIIHNENFKQAILEALSDEEIIKILNSTKKEAKSAIEIMKLYEISHSTVYRKIKWMLDNGLLVVVKIKITDDGKKYSLLKSTIEFAKITYNDGKVTVDIKENASKLSLTAKQFLSLEGE